MRYILTLLLAVALAGPAFAAPTTLIDSRTTPSETNLNGVITPVTGVLDYTTATDHSSLNNNVILQGSLNKSGMTGNNYILTDNTGSVQVQIDEHVIGNYKFGTNNVVRVRGNIFRPAGGDVTVDVDTVELIR